MKEKKVNKSKKNKVSLNRRNNAKLYPIYKMFSWDLLFFYSIEFLFYTITKKVTASEILIINGFYLLFRIICQMPALMITDFLGKRKSIIIGNILLIINILLLIFVPGAAGIILGYFAFALGFDIKILAESNLLYDSVATKGGEGLYSKLDTKGGSWYYILDGITSIIAGYLFVINNYLPMVICLIFTIISTLISFKFKDIYETKKPEKGKIRSTLREYRIDIRNAFKFIFKSRRLRAFVLFQIVFYSIIRIVKIYNSELLVNIGVPEEQFSMIFAAMALLGGVSLSFRESIEKKYKNKTLTVISLSYIFACVVIGIIASITLGKSIVPIILIMLTIQKICTSLWYVLEYKYLKNFTTEKNRSKITFTYEFLGGVATSICSIIGGLLLNVYNVQNAFLLVGLFGLACMIVVLDYMKDRIGLKPTQYKKEDIEFELDVKK